MACNVVEFKGKVKAQSWLTRGLCYKGRLEKKRINVTRKSVKPKYPYFDFVHPIHHKGLTETCIKIQVLERSTMLDNHTNKKFEHDIMNECS